MLPAAERALLYGIRGRGFLALLYGWRRKILMARRATVIVVLVADFIEVTHLSGGDFARRLGRLPAKNCGTQRRK